MLYFTFYTCSRSLLLENNYKILMENYFHYCFINNSWTFWQKETSCWICWYYKALRLRSHCSDYIQINVSLNRLYKHWKHHCSDLMQRWSGLLWSTCLVVWTQSVLSPVAEPSYEPIRLHSRALLGCLRVKNQSSSVVSWL